MNIPGKIIAKIVKFFWGKKQTKSQSFWGINKAVTFSATFTEI